ncbi:hypothetical protein QO034_19610 [Sedimentitalea sp. JM2-8]|uniref:PDZ domain-containing protein n=1 Tax=Sedimentitalea xiamensis TaxID=3050037 RepID=A0ABT7FJH3_9RHOB|nr:hypothetical protein [Sedimentitalea xiamensis]MDK3075292.1 hypothetical protein [Sedimentitalea xiamensis]
MTRPSRNTLAPLAACLLAACPLQAQEDVKLTEEDQAKLDAYNVFRADIDSFLPTVNVYDAEALPVTFPFRDVMAHVVVDVSFDGETALPFMLDTGAPTIVTYEIIEAWGGEVVFESPGMAGGNTLIWTPTTLIPAATVQDVLPITKLTAGAGWEAGSAFYCITQHGLLGAPAMRNGVWQIDYGANEVTVAASADQLDHIEGAIALPFTIKPGTTSPTPHVQLQIGKETLEFVVDSGGGIPLTINTDDFASLGVEMPGNAPRMANIGGGAAGAFDIALTSLQLPVSLAGTEITTTVFVGDGMAPGVAGNMGHMFLKDFVVTFDWSTQMMHLDPLAEDGSVSGMTDVPAAGIGLQPDGSLMVTSLALGGRADVAGLTIGEKVVAVNGQDVSGNDPDLYCALSAAGIDTITTEAGETYDVSPIEGFLIGGK